jgi:hypothetical protein
MLIGFRRFAPVLLLHFIEAKDPVSELGHNFQKPVKWGGRLPQG